ncbi:hypothetical protein GG344DRAFT_67426 [Lentinula edodes]|nr:hypothetical protein GG344DRAFT_67426 [Lentinula edodes]
MPAFTKSIPVALLVGASALASPIAPQNMTGQDLCITPCILSTGQQICALPYNDINPDDPATFTKFRPSNIDISTFEKSVKECKIALSGNYVNGNASLNSSSTSNSNSTLQSNDAQSTVLNAATAQNGSAPGVMENGNVGLQTNGPARTSVSGPVENTRVDLAQTNGPARVSESASESGSPSSTLGNSLVADLSAGLNSLSASSTNSDLSTFGVDTGAGSSLSTGIITGVSASPSLPSHSGVDSSTLTGLANGLDSSLGLSYGTPSVNTGSTTASAPQHLSADVQPDSTSRQSSSVSPPDVSESANGQIGTGPSNRVAVANPVNKNTTGPSGRVGITRPAQPSTPSTPSISGPLDVSQSTGSQTGSSTGVEVSGSANPGTASGTSSHVNVASSSAAQSSPSSSDRLDISEADQQIGSSVSNNVEASVSNGTVSIVLYFNDLLKSCMLVNFNLAMEYFASSRRNVCQLKGSSSTRFSLKPAPFEHGLGDTLILAFYVLLLGCWSNSQGKRLVLSQLDGIILIPHLRTMNVVEHDMLSTVQHRLSVLSTNEDGQEFFEEGRDSGLETGMRLLKVDAAQQSGSMKWTACIPLTFLDRRNLLPTLRRGCNT